MNIESDTSRCNPNYESNFTTTTFTKGNGQHRCHCGLKPSAFYQSSGEMQDRDGDRAKYTHSFNNGIVIRDEQISDKSDTVFPKENVKEKELKPSNIMFFASNSTFHGMSHICVPGGFTLRKALWALAFFSSLSLFLCQAYDRYAFYSERPHVTKLDEQEAVKMKFPAITICNLNSFRFGEITTRDYYYVGNPIFGILDDNHRLKEMRFKDNRTWPIVVEKTKPLRDENYINQLQKNTQNNFNMSEFYDRTGHSLFGIIKSCLYRGRNCLNKKEWIPIFTRYGKCYTFNSGKNGPALPTLKGGIDNGLEVLLDTQQDEYMPVWAETDEISVEAGFKVQIHVQTEPPFIHELGFGISPGFQTLVATQEQRITFLPKPYGNCSKGIDKKKHQHYDMYSISACRITCETKEIVRSCSCRMIHMPGDAEFCDPERYKECADPKLDELMKKDEKKCLCDTPCNVTRYNLEMSTLQLPSTRALSYLAYKYNRTENYVRNNFAKLNVFFEALNYETIEQKIAYEIPGLLGDIGGQMGLFIGASLLTILELFDYIYEVVKEKMWGKRLSKEKRKAGSDIVTDKNVAEDEEDEGYPSDKGRFMNEQYRISNRQHLMISNQSSSLNEFHSDYKFNTTKRNYFSPPSHYQLQAGNAGAVPVHFGPYSKTLEGRVGQNSLSHRKMSTAGRETSMSYNNLYVVPENNWKNCDFAASRYSTTDNRISPNEYADSNLTHPQSYLTPSVILAANGSQNQCNSQITSPARTLGDLQMSHSVETDIH
ncbi:unnamed protein product [Clavelina lepadiformis]|uniref:Acid-sensing ion channel 1 n=1 Tax=Clavelina lepadiformis TaxID=159417 RepID=A0ABP0FVP6_CLALP